MEPNAPRPGWARAVLSTAPGSRAPLALLCALLAACCPAATAAAAPAPDPRSAGARALARCRAGSGGHAAVPAALVGHVIAVDAVHAATERRTRGGEWIRRPAPPPPLRRTRPAPTHEPRPSGRRRAAPPPAAPEPGERQPATRRSCARTRAERRTSRHAQRPRPTPSRSPGSANSSRAHRTATTTPARSSWQPADSSHSSSQAAHSSQSRHACGEVSCDEAAACWRLLGLALLPAAHARGAVTRLPTATRRPAQLRRLVPSRRSRSRGSTTPASSTAVRRRLRRTGRRRPSPVTPVERT